MKRNAQKRNEKGGGKGGKGGKKGEKKKEKKNKEKTYIDHPIGDLAHAEACLGAKPFLLVLSGVGMVSMGEEPLLEELGDGLWELSATALLGSGKGGHHVGGSLTRGRSPHGTSRRGRLLLLLLRRRNGGWTNCDRGREVVGGHVAGGEHELLVGVVWAMRDTRVVVVSGDAWLGGERVPIARGRGGRRGGSKGSPRCGWPGSGGRRRIGAVVIERRELGTGTRRLGRIDGGGELEGVESLMGWVPSARCRGRGTFWERACGGQGAEGGKRGGWLRVGEGVDWGEEEALVEVGRWLLIERGRIGRGLGVGTHPAEVIGVGWVHGRRGREVVAGGGGNVAAVVTTFAAAAAAAVAAAAAAGDGVVVVVVVVVGDVDGIFTSDSDDRGQTGDSGDGGEEGADKGADGSVSHQSKTTGRASERQTTRHDREPA